MNNNKEQFNKGLEGLKRITLDENKKREIRENLMSHIKGNPQNVSSPYSSTFFLKRYKIAVISLFAVSFGTAFASAPSLPGDFLYPVKTQVVEPIIKFAKLTPEAEIKYEAELANTRIAEMQELQIKNRVTEENTRQNQELFQASIVAIETFKAKRPEKKSIVEEVIDLDSTVNLYNNLVLSTSTSYSIVNIATSSTGTSTTTRSGFKNTSKIKIHVSGGKNGIKESANSNYSTSTNVNHVVNEVINNVPGVNISNHSTSSVQSTTSVNTTNTSASTHINEVITNTVNSVINTGGIFK